MRKMNAEHGGNGSHLLAALRGPADDHAVQTTT
jgi:hypothetical protein